MASPRMHDDELAIVLEEIGRALPVPRRRLAPLVRARLERPRPRPWWAARPLVPALATAALLLAVIFVASPEVRAAARELFRIGGVQIAPVPSPVTPPSATPSPLVPGRRTTLDDARRSVSFPVLVPALLGSADEVVVDTSAGERVTLVYRSRPDIPASSVTGVAALVVEMRGSVQTALFGKAVGPGTTLEAVEVAGSSGFWLQGSPHLFFYLDAAGAIRDETLRLAGNTLLWTRDGVTYRLEAQLGRDDALRIANSAAP